MFQRFEAVKPPVCSFDPTHRRVGVFLYPNPAIFDSTALMDLLQQVVILDPPKDDADFFDVEFSDGEYEYKIIRYLVKLDGSFCYSFEGPPSPKIPVHSQMAPYALAAGNMMFNANNELVKINHQSGDFLPSFESLQYAFRFLESKSGVRFNSDPDFAIQVEEFVSDRQFITHEVTLRQIRAFALSQALLPLPQLVAAAPTLDNNGEVQLTAPQATSGFKTQPPAPKRQRSRSNAFLFHRNPTNETSGSAASTNSQATSNRATPAFTPTLFSPPTIHPIPMAALDDAPDGNTPPAEQTLPGRKASLVRKLAF